MQDAVRASIPHSLLSTDFIARGFLLWLDPGIVRLHVICDSLIALSYFAIAIALFSLIRKRKDLAFRSTFLVFGIFILARVATHVLNIVTLWAPVYWLDSLMEAIAAAASLIACAMLIRLVPAALRLPSPNDLRAEIALRTEAEQQLRQLNLELEDRVRERAARVEKYTQAMEHVAFIASHDLREPLHTVHTFTELLARRCKAKLDDEDEKLMMFIVGGARRMQTLIDDLLEYTRVIKSTNAENLGVPTSLEDAAHGAIAILDTSIRQTGAEIRIQPGLPVVCAQLAPLRQVFQNLLSNAIKYRRPGSPIKIEIRAMVRGSLGIVTVQDDGIGLDMRFSASIFEAFKRLHGPEVPGSGVGLALCKSVIQSFGGSIWVESGGLGKGSQFHFILPLEQTADIADAIPAAIQQAS